jgi:hypothetical protein
MTRRPNKIFQQFIGNAAADCPSRSRTAEGVLNDQFTGGRKTVLSDRC